MWRPWNGAAPYNSVSDSSSDPKPACPVLASPPGYGIRYYVELEGKPGAERVGHVITSDPGHEGGRLTPGSVSLLMYVNWHGLSKSMSAPSGVR